jgi:hypothetical protein
MTQTARDILDRVSSWPQEDIEELAETARVIEARRTGHYDVTPDEEAAIREGLAELDRGEWATEEAMRAFWQRCGVLWSSATVRAPPETSNPSVSTF